VVQAGEPFTVVLIGDDLIEQIVDRFEGDLPEKASHVLVHFLLSGIAGLVNFRRIQG